MGRHLLWQPLGKVGAYCNHQPRPKGAADGLSTAGVAQTDDIFARSDVDKPGVARHPRGRSNIVGLSDWGLLRIIALQLILQ